MPVKGFQKYTVNGDCKNRWFKISYFIASKSLIKSIMWLFWVKLINYSEVLRIVIGMIGIWTRIGL